MFQAEWRLFIKQRKIWILYLIYFLGSILQSLRVLAENEWDTVYCMLHMIELDKYSFIFFLVLSYLYLSRNNRSGIHEVITASGKEYFTVAMLRIAILQILNIILTCCLAAMNLLLAVYGNIGESNYYFYIIELWLLYHALPCLLASLLGLSLSGLNNKRMEYSGIALLSYMFSGTFPVFLQSMSEKTEIIYRFADIFCIFARGTRRSPNYYYLIPIESNNYFRTLTWCFICILIAVFLFGKKRKTTLAGILAVVSLGLLILYICPSGNAYFDDKITNHDEWTADQSYYKNYEILEEEAEFAVTEYWMDIKINRQMSAEVTMQLDESELERYIFTLYHGYEIRSVRDGSGRELSYDREGDYLTVWNDTDELEQICITYEGCSRHFYATAQGVLLPSYFAYYPVPGFCSVFEYIDGYGEEYTRNRRFYSVYHVTVDAPEELYCSLPDGLDGGYEGYAEGVTLLGSLFVDCKSVDNCRIIYPTLEYSESEMEVMYRELAEEHQEFFENRDIFIMPYSMYPCYYFDDSLILTYGFWELGMELKE